MKTESEKIQYMIDDLLDYKAQSENIYAGDYGKDQHKEIGFRGDGTFFVKHHRKLVLTTMQPYEAVVLYLSL